MVPRRAALARISSWLSGPDRFLLVTGGMGTGKSVLARQVVAQLRAANIVHAPHFCQADNTATIAVTALLGGWSGRLCESLPGFYEDLARDGGIHITGTARGPGSVGVRIDDVRITVGDEPPADTFVRVIGRPLDRLAASGQLPDVVLIVDGVEEARDADGRNRILALLSGLTGAALPPGVRILATSRPERGVRVALESVAHLDLDAIGTEDVAEYIALRADRRFATRLSEHVQGNFLLASGILDDLAGPLTTAAIPALPSSLPAIFRKRLWRMLDEHDQHTLDVLGLLAIAREPLQETEIAALLGTERHHVRASLNRILPLLAPARERHRLFHRALAEFLLNPDENPLPVRSAGSLHRDIATRMYETWAGRWDRCDDRYALHHLVAHLTMAPGAPLAGLITDPGFLQAKAARLGIDELHADLQYARAQVPDADRISCVVLREAHHLRDWDPRELPGFFLQQLRNATSDEQLATVLSGQLERRGLAHLRGRWRTQPHVRRTHVLRGHRGDITAVLVTPDGRRVITTATDGTARIWDADTGRQLRVLGAHPAALTCAARSPDGTLVVTGAEDGLVHVWNIDSGTLLHRLTGAEDRVTGVGFTPDGTLVVAGSWDRAVRVWSVHSGHQLRAITGHHGRIDLLSVTPNGHAITESGDGTRRVWDVRTGRQLAVGPLASPSRILISATTWGRHEFVAAGDTVQVCDPPWMGGLHRTIGRITAMAATPDGQRLVAGTDDGAAWVWDAGTGRAERLLTVSDDPVTALALSGNDILTGSWNGTVRIWNLASGQCRHTLVGHTDQVTAITLTGNFAVTASWDTTVRVWALGTGQERHILRGHQDWVTALAPHPDGTLAATGSADGTVRVWNVHTGQLTLVLPHRSPVTAVAFTPAGIITAARDGNARIWDPRDGTPVRLLAGHEGAITALAVTESLVVTGSEDGTAVVWDPLRGEPEHTIEGHPGPVTAVAAGTYVVTASGDSLRVWRPGLTLRAGLPDPITALVVHPAALAVGTGAGGLFSYQIVDQGRRT